MSKNIARVSCALAAVLLLASCDDTTSPLELPQVYVLRTLGNQTLPAANGANIPGTTIADTILVYRKWNLLKQTMVFQTPQGSAQRFEYTRELPGADESLIIDFHCSPVADACPGISAPSFGHFRRDSLVFEDNGWSPKRVYIR